MGNCFAVRRGLLLCAVLYSVGFGLNPLALGASRETLRDSAPSPSGQEGAARHEVGSIARIAIAGGPRHGTATTQPSAVRPSVPAVVATQAQADQPVGEAPEPERPEVTAIAEIGGVLTPRGTLVVDPQIEYVHHSEDRFFFQGVEIIDTVLIGAIQAESVSGDAITPSFGARYGVTNRLEIDFRVPWVYRHERQTVTPPGGTETTDTLTAHDIGDVEAGIHYQVNDGTGGWPFFIANLRGKTDTGKGPFDVDFDSSGLPTELPTGSGFISIEPSTTMIYPTDPVVFFVNLGYQWNVKKDVDTFIPGTGLVGDVDPGDAIKGSFGMGLALNERTSFSIGYEHNYILESDFEVNGVETDDESLQIGSFLFGFSQRWTDRFSTNLNFAVGVTEDAPDIRITLSTPISFDLLGLY